MEIFSVRKEDKLVQSYEDPVILGDPRVIEKLRILEPQYVVTTDYFTDVQSEVKPSMRKICLGWVLEVNDNECLEPSVFPLAVNYFDRFLCTCDVKKTELQLLGGVCLMLASKLRMSVPIKTNLRAAYTDYLYGPDDILSYERTVLNQLRWNLGSVIPTDYLDYILYNLPNFERFRSMVFNHSKVFIQLAIIELEFISWTPSSLAVGAIGAAIKGLPRIKTLWPEVENLVHLIQEMTNIEADIILHSIRSIEGFIERHVSEVRASTYRKRNEVDFVPTNKVYDTEVELRDTMDDNPDTPTDVQDVHI